MRYLSFALMASLSAQAGCKSCSSTELEASGGSKPVPAVDGVPFDDVTFLVAGDEETCVLVASGAAFCAGGARQAYHPELSMARPIPGAEHTTHLSIGENACAVQESGEVVCWGDSRNHSLPKADPGKRIDTQSIPGLPPSSHVLTSSAALPYWAFTRQDGSAWQWGGTAFDTAFVAPTKVAGLVLTELVQVEASKNFNCARLRSGGVTCWDLQGYVNEQLVLSVKGLPSFRPAKAVDIAVSYATLEDPQIACVLDPEGRATCWRYVGDLLTDPEPFQHPFVGTERWKDIALGANHGCGIRRDGSVWCTGWNRYGQLGVTEPSTSEGLVQVPGLVRASAVAVGYDHSCALLEDRSVTCWGSNQEGQCGAPGRSKQVAPTAFLRFVGKDAAH